MIGVQAVILEYNNGSTWQNKTMSRISGNITNGIYQTNITLEPVETNYTFNIRVNDTVGNVNQSTNHTFKSAWDCTWNITSGNANQYSLGETGGFSQTLELGNLSLINTGDIQYSNNNCSITFNAFDTYANFSWSYILASGTSRLVYKNNGTSVSSLQ